MGLDFGLTSAIGEGAKTAISSALAIAEFIKARKMEKANIRPTEAVPQGVLDATAQAKLLAEVGMTSTEYNRTLQGIDRSGTKAVAEARDRRSALDVISTSEQASNDAILGLGADDERQRIANMQNLIGQLNTQGGWQDKIWQWNFAQKYQENADAIRALKGAAYANLGSALNTGLSAGAELANRGSGGATPGVRPGGSQQQVSLAAPSTNPTPKDPTMSNPDMFTSGIPTDLLNFLKNMPAIPGITG